MKQTFYYADFDLTVTINDGKNRFLRLVNKTEMQALQLNIWHAISAFFTARSLFHASLIDKDKIRGSERVIVKDRPNGG